MSPLDLWCVQMACRDTIVRAAAAVDACDAAGLAALFTDDATLQRPGAEPVQGRTAIRQVYANRPAGRITRHLITNTLVDLVDAGHARATSVVLVWSGSVSDAPGPPGPHGRPAQPRQLVGEFHDELELTGTGWRIAHRRAEFVLHSP